MTDLRGARIDLNKVGGARIGLEHEVKTVQTGEFEAAHHPLCGGRHFWMLDAP
jgi:hypothetical protein